MTESETGHAASAAAAAAFCCFLRVKLTESVCEGETLHHALEHEGLFCRRVRDQPVPLRLEPILSSQQNTDGFSYGQRWTGVCELLTFTSRYKHAAVDSFTTTSPCLKAGSCRTDTEKTE